MSLRSSTVFVLSALFSVSSVAVPQEPATPSAKPNPPAEPRIGLVLEGGAALGLAHIGVIKYLEEHRIPVHYVAGTSMGGLIGGLYATGHSSAEIEALVEGIDWNVVLRGEVPFQDLPYRRKQDAEDFPNQLEFGIKQGVRFPAGFNSGHQVGLILDRIALPYSEINSFNDLPIPFACVGTDLVNKKAHVFRSGSLSVALRSTMSLPGIFTPVRANETVFVDGGLLDNLPVDVAQELGADLTIAVHLETKPLGVNDPLSSVGVLGRSISVVIAANELASMQKADVLVSVPLQDFASTDYEQFAKIIKLGYEAAAKKAAVLSRLSVDEPAWQAYLAQLKSRRRTAPPPQFVQVEGGTPREQKNIEAQLASTIGKPINTPELDKKLTYMLGDGRFASVGYQMTGRAGQQGLLIKARDKEYSPPSVRPLLVIDGTQVERVQFMAGARFTFMDIGRYGTEWRNDLVLGSEHGLQSEFYFPFGKDLKLFIAPRILGAKLDQDFYKSGSLLAEYRNQVAAGAFDFGYTPSRSSELRLGYLEGYQKLTPTVGSLPIGSVSGEYSKGYAHFALDRRNDPIVATDGMESYANAEWHAANPGASEGFPLASLQLAKYQPLTHASSLFFTASGGSTFSHHKTGFPPFQLGGGPDLYAYGKNEFLANQYFLFRGGYQRKVFSLPALIGDKAYLTIAAEGAKIYDLPAGTSSLPGDVAGGILIKTIFGPVIFGGGYGATGHAKIFYQVGKTF